MRPRHAVVVRGATALAGALACACAVVGSSTPASARVAQGPRAVVVIAVPDLRWSDLAQMPRLRSFAATGYVGDLSVRTEPAATRCAGGELGFNASGRVRDAGVSCTVDAAHLRRQRRADMSDRFGAAPGALGDALQRAGRRTAAVGPEAAALLANRAGRVDSVVPDVAFGLHQADVVAVVDDEIYRARSGGRAAAAAAADESIGAQLGDAQSRAAVVIVAGISDAPTGGAHIHVVVMSSSDRRHGVLSSGTTQRRPWVQLVDLAPTVLDVLGIPVPDEMIGRPVRRHAGEQPSPATLADDDHHAQAINDVKGWILTALCLAALLGLLALFAGRRRIGLALLRTAVVLPALAFLAQLVPWWRMPRWAFGLALAAACVAAGWLVGRLAARSLFAAAVVVPAVTAAVLVADQLIGAPLQLSAPIGDNPLVAGRFHGLSNVPFALMASAALMVAALVAGRLRDTRARTGVDDAHSRTPSRHAPAVAVAVVIGLAVLVVDGAPSLGDDFGGLLTLPVALVVLVLVLAGVRLRLRWLVAAVAAGVVVAAGVALVDYSRPAADQTHLGRFVGSVLHHGGGGVLRRKSHLVLHSLGNVAVTGLVVAVVVVSAAVAGRDRLRAWADSLPGLGAGWAAVATLGVVGSVTNDSGLFVAAMAIVAGLLPPVAAGVPVGRLRGTG